MKYHHDCEKSYKFYNRLNQISIPSWQSRGTLAEYQIKTCHSDLLYRMHFTQIVKEEGADSFIKNNRSLVFFYTSQVCNRDISFLILNYKATGIITLLPFYSLKRKVCIKHIYPGLTIRMGGGKGEKKVNAR